MERNQIIHGDAYEVLMEMEVDSVNAIITDPPYNISTDFKLKRGNSDAWEGGTLSHDFGDWDKGDVVPEDWVPLCKRVLKENGVFISMYDNLNMGRMIDALRDQGFEIRQKVYWRKNNSIPQAFPVKWSHAMEEGIIATMNEGEGHHFTPKERRQNVVEAPICTGNKRYDHPTQKPEKIFEPIIEYWTNEGDLVVDPFCGTGTIPKVAYSYGRDYIGVEINEEWVQKARGRIGNRDNESRKSATDW